MLTDLPDALPVLTENAEAHAAAVAAAGGLARTSALDWRHAEDGLPGMLRQWQGSPSSQPQHDAAAPAAAAAMQPPAEPDARIQSHGPHGDGMPSTPVQARMPHVDLVVGADLVYSTAQVAPLVHALVVLRSCLHAAPGAGPSALAPRATMPPAAAAAGPHTPGMPAVSDASAAASPSVEGGSAPRHVHMHGAGAANGSGDGTARRKSLLAALGMPSLSISNGSVPSAPAAAAVPILDSELEPVETAHAHAYRHGKARTLLLLAHKHRHEAVDVGLMDALGAAGLHMRALDVAALGLSLAEAGTLELLQRYRSVKLYCCQL